MKLCSSLTELSKPSHYNLEITNGYIAYEKNDFSLAVSYFRKASVLFTKKPEPILLQCSIVLEEAYKSQPASEDMIKQCEAMVEKAAELRKDSEVSFYRGILRYILMKFDAALEDAKFSIEKADENLAEHYVFRGLCFAALSNYQEAVNDFSVALQLNENLDYVYNYRGRSAYLMDDSDLAYMDFQKLVNLNEFSPKPYVETAVVLMHSSSFSGAIASLENANSILYTAEAGYLKVKAYLLQYDMDSAINEFNILLESESASSSM